jgi:hypothetical protein
VNKRCAVRRKPVQDVPRRKVAHKRPQVARNAIVVAAPAPKPWLLSQDEVNILKNAVCKGATDDELKYCLAVARRYELDPFQGQIWFVKRWDSEAERTDGKKGSYVWVPVVGINGLLHIAARDHSDFGSYSEPEYGPMMTVEWTDRDDRKQKLQVPEFAGIAIYKKGCVQPTIAKVWWSEIYPDIDRAPLVRRMPRLMLAKCAKAQATRTAYPKTGGLLIKEETQTQEFTDITPGGRLILEPPKPETENPYMQKFIEREKEQLAKLNLPQKEVVAEKMKDAPEPALFYTYFPESETYRIDGTESLKTANRDLLKPLWNPAAGAIVATPSDLGRLISQFEQRHVPFRELKRF